MSGRSRAGEAVAVFDQLAPPFREMISATRSFFVPLFARGVGPFVHATAIAFGASAPVGAPFAMSMLGMLFVRAPPTPLKVGAPESGSKMPTGDTRVIETGNVKCAPPSSE